MKKYYIRHNSPTTLTATVNGAKHYFKPNVDTLVANKEFADAAIYDFNISSPNYKMEIVEVESETEE